MLHSTYYSDDASTTKTGPEAMETLKFTMASDVWSYGIVLIEIMQDGATPYPGIDNAVVMQKVMGGWRHPQPAECSTGVYETLCDCWAADVNNRSVIYYIYATKYPYLSLLLCRYLIYTYV